MRLNYKQIAGCTGGEFVVDPVDASELLTGISWDSREIGKGYLYVALPGERVDGHDFIDDALRAGARGALVQELPAEGTRMLARELGAGIIAVPNTYSAVSDLAREWRGHLRGRVIGLTGSTGKTTTKNLVRDVLSASFSVVATRANQNNELGVPRTLLNADPETEVVVVEMGMRGRGQIEALCAIARPDWGIITNVGESHIELLGSRENIARAKAELFAALPAGTGVAFINGADEVSAFLRDCSGVAKRFDECVCFDGSGSFDPDALGEGDWRSGRAVWAEDVSLDEQGRPCFELCARGFGEASQGDVERQRCVLGLRGMHNVSNAAAAAAVGRAMGMDLAVIAEALAQALPEAGRQEVLAARAGFTVINDAYNANPDSMKASLATFCSLKVTGRRVAVLGDMGELGDFAVACHRGVGRAAGRLPIDLLICVGELSEGIADGAAQAGMSEDRIARVRTVADVLELLDSYLEPGDAVLVKASHFMGLERVVEGLVS